ncbi:NTP transferase domain-containing protein [Tropicimonas sp. IMCC6043]|uniref:nucleotidyltransferase family protein n=1 Tax=Tropicimonas sp. IMCC6043 TaxID=2510645 RepID=UPI00101DE870|nr:nucleotidyltransferase family protein [Tropicimonas sp. IMCC6043]RYH07462.1 nucleotidyltransferase family protein [Tropicimonas sp. IMCC6043]
MRRVGLVLAAGQSRRFGAENKLLARVQGKPLAAWAAEAMRGVPLDHRLAVVSAPEVAALFAGFEILHADGTEAGLGDNLRLGAARAQALGAERLLVSLADMPLMRHGILAEILAACVEGGASAASDEDRRMPPACFSAAWLDRLTALDGDRGAGSLLVELPPEALVRLPAPLLADIDRPDDIAALEALGRSDEPP